MKFQTSNRAKDSGSPPKGIAHCTGSWPPSLKADSISSVTPRSMGSVQLAACPTSIINVFVGALYWPGSTRRAEGGHESRDAHSIGELASADPGAIPVTSAPTNTLIIEVGIKPAS